MKRSPWEKTETSSGKYKKTLAVFIPHRAKKDYTNIKPINNISINPFLHWTSNTLDTVRPLALLFDEITSPHAKLQTGSTWLQLLVAVHVPDTASCAAFQELLPRLCKCSYISENARRKFMEKRWRQWTWLWVSWPESEARSSKSLLTSDTRPVYWAEYIQCVKCLSL